MANYQCGQFSKTLSTIVLGGMLASHAVAATHDPVGPNQPSKLYRTYQSGATAHTYDQYTNVITGQYNSAPPAPNLEATITELYARLLSSQEALGDDFEEVLYESLWDLYEA